MKGIMLSVQKHLHRIQRYRKLVFGALNIFVNSFKATIAAPIEEVTPLAEVSSEEKLITDYPEVPPEIPYLIVGGGTAAYAAVRAIRKYDPAAKILILSKEDQA